MEQPKVTASELMAIVRDTNQKVTAIAETDEGKAKKAKIPYSKVGTVFAVQLIILGLCLTATVVFRSLMVSLGVVMPETLMRSIYVVYAAVTVLTVTLVRTNTVLKIGAAIMAIVPISICFILPLI